MLKVALFLLAAVCAGLYIHGAYFKSKVEKLHPPMGEIIEVNGSGVHVISKGEGNTPILIIHGAGANAKEFGLTLVPPLAEEHQVIVADRPGHGYSERFKHAQTFGVQALQMAGVIEVMAPHKKAVVFGHSYGGAVALRLAMDRPDLVKGVVLSAPVTHDWGPGKVAWYYAAANVPIVGHVFSQMMPIFGPGQARSQQASSFHPAPEPPNHYDDAGIDLLFRPANFRANAHDLVSLRNELIAQQARYSAIEVPVILFSGTADLTLDASVHAGQLEMEVEGIEVVAFEHEGHIPHYRRRDEVVNAIASLASLGTSR